MDFAQKHMQSLGWRSGRGLGAEGAGMTAALKPKLKFDNYGIGFRVTAGQADNDWWNQSFNCSANFVDFRLCQTSSGLKVKGSRRKRPKKTPKTKTDATDADDQTVAADKSAPDDDEEEDVSATDSVDKKYMNFFVKSAPKREECADDCADEEALDPLLTKNIDFDELYRKSGGVTAHKASRVGIKMSGKMKRIAEQNEEFRRKYQKLKQQND